MADPAILESVLRELLDKIALQHNFDTQQMVVKEINSGGANYTSTLFLVTVKLPYEKDIELFAKVACVGKTLREKMMADRLFYLEAMFYNKLSETYKELELKHNVAIENRYVFPKFYGCNRNKNEETIVLENLAAKGYECYNRFHSIDWEHAASAIEALAKFHALSFAYQMHSPEEFNEVCEDLVFPWPDDDDGSTKEAFENSVTRSLKVIKDEHKARVTQFLKKVTHRGLLELRKPLSTRVIVHGDYRTSNLLFKRQGNIMHTIPVDYQIIHVGSPALDLIYFEVFGTDCQFRAEYHDRLVEHYYLKLTTALQRFGIDGAVVYPKESLHKELRELTPYSVLLGMLMLPMVLVEEDKAPRIDGDDCSLETFVVPPNELFAERMAGIVDDCVRQGMI